MTRPISSNNRTDKDRARAVRYLNNHPEQREKQRLYSLERMRAARAADPASRRRLQVYRELAEQYGEVCCICGNGPTPRRRLSIDHDHGTDEIRGLLCGKCNLILGHAHDSVEILQSAIRFLSRDAYTGRMFAEVLSVSEEVA